MDADKALCGRNPASPYVELAVEIFAMLADATRVRIVLALRDGEHSVNTLADIVEKSPAAVSQHLAKLRLARVVATRQEGTRVFYRLANEHAGRLVNDAIFQAEHALSDAPAHHQQDAARDPHETVHLQPDAAHDRPDATRDPGAAAHHPQSDAAAAR